MIIFRYLTKEIYSISVTVTLVLLFVFLCNIMIHLLGMVTDGKIAASILFQLILLRLPELLGLLLPLGLYLGVLLAYGRLYADSEMTVLFATGLSVKRFVGMTLLIALGVALISALLMFWVNPAMTLRRDLLIQKEGQANRVATLLPGKFHELKHSVVYVEKISDDKKKIENLFIATPPMEKSGVLMEKGNHWLLVTAKEGYQHVDEKTGVHYLVAKNGYRYNGMPGKQAFEIVKFKEYGVHPKIASGAPGHIDESAMSTFSLFKAIAKGSSNAMAEFQWRLSIPLSALILAMLAIPLSKINPRQGRFSQLVPAILINIVYANLLFIGRAWVESGTVSPWVGMWWIHGLALILAYTLLRRQFGRWAT
jgi:lipopolysaccharide export system permease protein